MFVNVRCSGKVRYVIVLVKFNMCISSRESNTKHQHVRGIFIKYMISVLRITGGHGTFFLPFRRITKQREVSVSGSPTMAFEELSEVVVIKVCSIRFDSYFN